MSLNQQDLAKLADLLAKVDSIQIKGDVWHELVKKFITVPIELFIIDDQNRVFLVHRKDREFDAYHYPGTVINDWETVAEARKRLVAHEVELGAGLQITEPQPVGWIQVRRGVGSGENPTRHTVALVHIASFHGTWIPRDGMGFFPFDAIPENTLPDHKFLLQRVKQYLSDGQTILGA